MNKSEIYRKVYYRIKKMEFTLYGYSKKRKSIIFKEILKIRHALKTKDGLDKKDYSKLESKLKKLETDDNIKKSELNKRYSQEVIEFYKMYPETKTTWKIFNKF